MTGRSPVTHCVSAVCAVGADQAMAFLSDGAKLGNWALGSLATEHLGNGIFRGRSIDSGELVFSRLVPDRERGIVRYEVGTTADQLSPWIWSIVQPCDRLGGSGRQTVITLLAWRPASMSDSAWEMLQREHEVEILIIKAQLEREVG